MRRGEIWWANLPAPWGRRPVLLVARNEAYTLLAWVMVAPLTTALRAVPTVVQLDPRRDGVPRPSAVTLDAVQTIRKEWLESRIGRLDPQRMEEVEAALRFALALST
jgi:mRNA interferase MazF